MKWIDGKKDFGRTGATVLTLKRVSSEDGSHSAGNVHPSTDVGIPRSPPGLSHVLVTGVTHLFPISRWTTRLSVFTKRETIRLADRQKHAADTVGPRQNDCLDKTTAWTKTAEVENDKDRRGTSASRGDGGRARAPRWKGERSWQAPDETPTTGKKGRKIRMEGKWMEKLAW